MTAAHTTSPELDLLCHCDLANETQLRAFLDRQVAHLDWARFAALVAFNGTGRLVAAQLLPLTSMHMPSAFTAYLEERRRDHALLQVLQTAETARLVDLLERTGISAIVLKGAALAHSLYAADAASRYSSDIDLLVAPEALEGAARVLDEAGYEAAEPRCTPPLRGREMLLHLCYAFDFTHRSSGIRVELHHRLSPNPHVLDVPFSEIRGSCIRVATASGPLPTLDGAVSVGYLGWHALGHPVPRVKWISDFVRALVALESAERASLLAHCDEWGIGRGVRLAAALAGDLYRNVGREDVVAALSEAVPQHLTGMDCSPLIRALERACDLETERSLARLPAEISWLKTKLHLLTTTRARRFEVLRALSDPRDVSILGLDRGWGWLYALAGPPLAAARFTWRTTSSGRRRDAADR